MSASIVALSTADVTVRAAVVAGFAVVALALVADRMDFSRFARKVRRPEHIYVRVDRRPGQLHRPPDLRHRLTAAGNLAGLAIVGSVAIAVVVTLLISFLVGSVTDLLR